MTTNHPRDGARDGLRLEASTVREAARHQWPGILTRLGIADRHLRRQHGPCPGCGGRDRFRFDDRDGRGTWICSGGGADPLAGDGLALVRHVFGCGFAGVAGGFCIYCALQMVKITDLSEEDMESGTFMAWQPVC